MSIDEFSKESQDTIRKMAKSDGVSPEDIIRNLDSIYYGRRVVNHTSDDKRSSLAS